MYELSQLIENIENGAAELHVIWYVARQFILLHEVPTTEGGLPTARGLYERFVVDDFARARARVGEAKANLKVAQLKTDAEWQREADEAYEQWTADNRARTERVYRRRAALETLLPKLRLWQPPPLLARMGPKAIEAVEQELKDTELPGQAKRYTAAEKREAELRYLEETAERAEKNLREEVIRHRERLELLDSLLRSAPLPIEGGELIDSVVALINHVLAGGL